MMETVNTHRPINHSFVLIDGGLNLKNGMPSVPTAQKPKLLDQVRRAIRTRHYSPKTEGIPWVDQTIHLLPQQAAPGGNGGSGNRTVSVSYSYRVQCKFLDTESGAERSAVSL